MVQQTLTQVNMANPKGNKESLVKFKPKWKSGKTQTIRVPIAIAPLVLEAAKEIDSNGGVSLLQIIEELQNKLRKFESIKILDGKEEKNYSLDTDTSDTEVFLTDAYLAEIIGCDRSTLGKIRRKMLSGQVIKSKYMAQLTNYQALEKGWKEK